MDAVQKANAGHPGTAMALAPVAYVLYRERMRHDPADPAVGQPRPLRALGRARLHPPVRRAAPLGLRPHARRPQAVPPVGVAHAGAPRARARQPAHARRRDRAPGRSARASATRSAWRSAEAMLAERYNGDGEPLVDHRTYAICSDGDIMEGVSGEASSLAGFLGLGKLCLIYDDNHITIEGSTGLAFGEDVGQRYEAYGFHVQHLDDGWSTDDLRAALDAADARGRAAVADHRAHAHRDRRAARAGHARVARRARSARRRCASRRRPTAGIPTARSTCPDEVYAHFSQRERGAADHAAWDAAARGRAGGGPGAHAASSTACSPASCPRAGRTPCPISPAATRWRRASARAPASRRSPRAIPEFIGGSADLAPSTNTTIKAAEAVAGAPLANKENALADSVLPGRMGGRTLHFGIREHGMGAILNGMTAHGGFRAFGATFFVFSDYMRPAVRLACIMELPVIYVWTHDSIGVGEDGPTHQPIEHLASLRAMPHMRVIRPGRRDRDRRGLAARARAHRRARRPRAHAPEAAGARPHVATRRRAACARGGYVLADGEGGAAGRDPDRRRAPRCTTCSPRARRSRPRASRCASSPCPTGTSSWRRTRATATRCCRPAVWRRVSLEAGATFGWSALVGDRGTALGLDRYGASAPAPVIAEHLGITPRPSSGGARAAEALGGRSPAIPT